MKIMRVVGARPQLMQTPTIFKALVERNIEHVLVHTNQHYTPCLSETIESELALPKPDKELKVGSGTHGSQTGVMLSRLEAVMVEEKPDAVLIDGDTNSTVAAALAGAKLNVPVLHIEGGVRSYDRSQPEEVNRVVTDHLATLNFAPIPEALDMLEKENLKERSFLTGDVLLDCFQQHKKKANHDVLEQLSLTQGNYRILTVHRQDTTDNDNGKRFFEIVKGVSRLQEPVVFPVHPRSRPLLDMYIKNGNDLGQIIPIEPVSYLQMIGLLENAKTCLTDSGGLQRESLWMGIPTVVLHERTMWPQFIDKGWAVDTKLEADAVEQSVFRAPKPDGEMISGYFGSGLASQKIAEAIVSWFEKHSAGI